ncbi:MAG: hypothetical protein ACRDZR_01325 [Acidimicrobiales bacterium]
MDKQQQITAFLDRHITLLRAPMSYAWRGVYPWAQTPAHPVGPRPTTEQVANELLTMAEFRSLQLGTWLGTTDGQVIAQAVEAVTPPFYREDIELLVSALEHAAALQQKEGQEAAGRYALGAIGVAAFLAIIFAVSTSGGPGTS